MIATLIPAAGSVALFAALAYAIDIIGLTRLAMALSHRFGAVRGVLFACVMRKSWMSAHAAAFHALPSSMDRDCYAFGSGRLGLLFFPGALVAYEAYAPVLRALSEASGATVVCARLPHRHPIILDEASVHALLSRFPHVRSWAIGGHSMGAGRFGAAGLVRPLRESGARVAGLLMWAGAASGGLDLSGEHSLPTLALLGTEDPLVHLEGKAEDGTSILDGVTKLLPRGATYELVRGGNHAGFAHYGPQRFPISDGERSISLEEQQRQVVRHSARFLRGLGTR